MRRIKAVAGVVLLTFAVSGCAAMQSRRWGWCGIGGGLLGAAVGGALGGVLTSEYEGGDGGSDEEVAAIAAAGFVGGGALGAILGHLICDPEDTPPPPPPVAKPVPPPTGTKITEIKGPHFDFDRATIKPEGKARLDNAVRLMKEHPTLRVTAVGHTDSVGSDAYNLKLGEKRARAVANYLVDQGVSASRIDVRSEGESRPVANNSTADGRAENRRVEIIAL